MRPTTAHLIDVGLAHLGRFAFFTRDNPFLSATPGRQLGAQERQVLGALLERELSVREWLRSREGQRMQEAVGVRCLPRDVQQVSLAGEAAVGVESVHAFLHAPVFWWLISILWTIAVGRRLDPALGDHVIGYRLAAGFVERPSRHRAMFRAPSYDAWKAFPATQAAERPGETLAATTLDIRDFYYSVSAPPSRIVKAFTAAAEVEVSLSSRGAVLTMLLDALHAECSRRYEALEPRGPLPLAAAKPLPVGPPSSRVLANLIMQLVADDLLQNPHVLTTATYADDVVLLSQMLPEVREDPRDYLERIGVLGKGDVALKSPAVTNLAELKVGLDKSGTALVRASSAEGEEPEDGHVDPLDPYIAGDPSPEWGGGLQTVLRPAYKRERVPRAVVNDIRGLVDEIRVGLDPEEAAKRVRSIVDDLDNATFLAIRPHWTDLLVAATAALGVAAVPALTTHFDRLARAISPPDEATEATVEALYSGLRAAWIHALGQALSVAFGRDDLTALIAQHPKLVSGGPIGDLPTERVVRYAGRLRARRLVDPHFVAVPLAEFTTWTGPLIGEGASAGFLAWSTGVRARRRQEILKERLKQAVRFISLHEACLALHTWAGPGTGRWLEKVFNLMKSQPLVDHESLDDLRSRARHALAPVDPAIPGSDEEHKQLVLRIAVPSMPISEVQLKAILNRDRAGHGEIVRKARKATMHVALAARRRRTNVLVLPEWAVPAELVPWLMELAATTQMLVVAGQAPTVRSNRYSNVLWVGIPLLDNGNHKSCLIPPPREKNYLSPHEEKALEAAGIAWESGAKDVPTYSWSGFSFASLICFEFAEIRTRQSLRDTADVLTVSSLNRDWRYFAAIQEATTRDNYCLTICVNTGAYPGTQIMRPTLSAKALAASVHGSEDATIVTRVIDLFPIVSARRSGQCPAELDLPEPPEDDATLSDYKPLPPG
jgi:hypothetical protein